MTTFQPFPKLARLARGCVITEKLDGTNACVVISESTSDLGYKDLWVQAQSRTRMITPGKSTDNYGFAAWVKENEEELKKLGPGYHYGEWFGKGIQRGYNLETRHFALFDTHKWPEQRPRPSCITVVPVLHQGEFSTHGIDEVMFDLRSRGSRMVPGFADPEGVVIYHEASKVAFKKTFDDGHKEAKAA